MIRAQALIFTLLTAFVIWRALLLLRVPHAWFGLLMFIGTPQVLHISTLNFGHAPSMFVLALGFYCWASQRSICWAVVAGLCWGIAAYGYPGYLIFAPIVLLIFVITQSTPLRLSPSSTRFTWLAALTGGVAWLPILFEARSNPEFLSRLSAKNESGADLTSLDAIWNALQNYPKYARIDYLFVTGEANPAADEILRHSLINSGLLAWAFLPVLLACLIRLAMERRQYQQRWAIPFVLIVLAAPIPDLLTTTLQAPPYSFILAMALPALPFVACAGLNDLNHAVSRLLQREITLLKPLAYGIWVQIVVLCVAIMPAYSSLSSGFWGWQWGMEPVMQYYEEHADEWTALRMDPWFNRPTTLATYYLEDDALLETIEFTTTRPETQVPEGTLVALGAEYVKIASYEESGWSVVEELPYPNGDPAWVLMAPPTGR